MFVCFCFFCDYVGVSCHENKHVIIEPLFCSFGFGGLCYPTTTHAGYNARYFHGFQPEDFIGKMAVVCQAANNSRVEHVALARFYLGYLAHALWDVCFFFTTAAWCFKICMICIFCVANQYIEANEPVCLEPVGSWQLVCKTLGTWTSFITQGRVVQRAKKHI